MRNWWRQIWKRSRYSQARLDRPERLLHFSPLRVEQLEDRIVLNAYTDLASTLDGVTAVQDNLSAILNTASKVPLLTQNGKGALGTLKEVQLVTKDVVNDLKAVLNDTTINSDTVMESKIATVFGVAPADVRITHPGGDATIEVEVYLHKNIASTELPLNLDLGLSGLPVKVGVKSTGSIDATINYNYALGFGYDGSKLFVDPNTRVKDFNTSLPDPNHQFLLTAQIAPSSTFLASATVGLLQAKISPNAQDPGLNASFTVDNIGLTGTPTYSHAGSAHFNLHAAASFGTTDTPTTVPFKFPGIGADLVINWADVVDGTPTVAFNNVSFQLGSFLSDFVRPILKDIQAFTKPMQPVNDVLTAPLPGLSDLSNLVGGGDVTILGIAKAYAASGAAGGYAKLIELIGILSDICKGINSIETSSGNLMVPLGNFSLDTSNATVRDGLLKASVDFTKLGTQGVDLAPDLLNGIQGSDVIKGIDAVANKLGLTGDAKSALEKIGDIFDPNFKLDFPILDDPASVIFPLLLGSEGSDMVSLDAQFNIDNARGGATYGMFGVGIGATFKLSASGKLHLGYDTYGLREFFADLSKGNTKPADLLDGLYVRDDSYLMVNASLGIEAKVTYAIFSVSVEGGAFTSDPIIIHFHDPDHAGYDDQGRLRLSKLGNDMGRILDVVGTLDAGVQIEVKIGYDPPVGPFIGVTHTFDIASVNLLDLGKIDKAMNADGQTTGHLGANGIPSDHPPVIAGDSNGHANTDSAGIGHVGADGILYLYLGDRSVDRANGPPTEDVLPETWEVSHVSGDASNETVMVNAFGVSQTFTGVKKIMAVGNLASQTITIDEGVAADAELTAGLGSMFTFVGLVPVLNLVNGVPTYQGSQLTYLGTGRATLYGRDGPDRLTVGPKSKASDLHGGKGDDVLFGGGGNDRSPLARASTAFTAAATTT